MARTRTEFVCRHCGAKSLRWVGQCPKCSEWNSMEETAGREGISHTRLSSIPLSSPERLSDITSDTSQRIEFSLTEFCRVMGGGIVPGSVTLVSGSPGIGKSTLLLQIAAMAAGSLGKALYASGEESSRQIKMRAERLGLSADGLYLLSETNLTHILEHIHRLSPELVIVDSIQTVYLEESSGSAGNVTQIRECTNQLMRLAKGENIPVFIAGHVTKSGDIAGPRVLEHIVDTVLYLEGDRFQSYRLLRSVKNRFGSTNEVGVFEMGEQGLLEVENPSQAFLAERLPWTPGSSVAVTMEGTRPLLVEIQALTSTTSFGLPRRRANGIDFNRLLLLVAVLTKRIGLKLSNQDIFVNVVGGLRIDEPAADLSVAVAIASSFRNLAVPPDMAIMGEIGLLGELRAVSQADRRLHEAAELGFKRCLIPKTVGLREKLPTGLEVIGAGNLESALEVALVR